MYCQCTFGNKLLPISLSLFLGLSASQLALSAGLPHEYQAIGGREAVEAAKQTGKPILIYFAQPQCGWCEKLEGLLQSSTLKPALVRDYHFVNVNIARSKDVVGKQLQQILDVRGTPAIAALSAKAVPLCMIYGDIADDKELAKVHANIQTLNNGGRSLAKYKNGMASCRGKVSVEDDQVSEIRPSTKQ